MTLSTKSYQNLRAGAIIQGVSYYAYGSRTENTGTALVAAAV